MKALQVITSLEMGGAETLVVNLIPRLCALGHTVDLCIFNGAETPLMQRLKVESPQTKIYALGHSVYNPIYIATENSYLQNIQLLIANVNGNGMLRLKVGCMDNTIM